MRQPAATKKTSPPEKVKSPKRLDQMANNPKGDWTMRDINHVASKLGMDVEAPSSGSHYTVFSKYLAGALTVPKARPIKPIYIKKFVNMCKAHIDVANEAAENE